jgi:SAM-dependent methyltransferase
MADARIEGRPSYRDLVAHYERCLERFGDTARGVDWPDEDDAATRYRIMLELVRQRSQEPVDLLDFGCGAAHLYDYILGLGLERRFRYTGVDMSPRFLALCRRKHPTVPFHEVDVLEAGAAALPESDYIVMNGVLTEKRSLSHEAMLSYARELLRLVFERARVGLAFNVMSKQVDWERKDLFHVGLDEMTTFVGAHLSRDFIVRHDYGLYEYTVYVYRKGSSP